MQEEDILEHTHSKCRFCILHAYFSELVDHCVTMHAPQNTIEHTHVKILVSALERQVS